VIALADRRLRLMLAVSLVAFLAVAVRAGQIQIVDAAALRQKAVAQQRQGQILPGTRGAIISSDGQVLAQDQLSKTIAVPDPKLIRHPFKEATAVARAMGYHPFHLRKTHTKRGKVKHKLVPVKAWPRHVEAIAAALQSGGYGILRQLPPEVAGRIMAKHLPGLETIDEVRRSYPFHAIGSQVLGFTNIDDQAGVGQGAGLEHQYDRYLAGRPGRQVSVYDPTRTTVLETVRLRRPVPGRSITVTLDTAIQTKVQAVLAHTVKASGAAWATGIVLDPRTGSVLAMATAPGYDDNRVHSLAGLGPTHNNAVETTYEPGSTFKVVTFSAALSAGLIWPGETFTNLPYALRFGNRWIHDDVKRGPVTLTATQILQKSSNIGTDTIAGQVGEPLLMRWIDAYGFGRTTGIGLPGESPGIVLPGNRWSDSSIGTIPIGQGIGVTAMQMASMYQAIANGGVMVQPRLVTHIQGERLPRQRTRRVLSPQVDSELVRMLGSVVTDAGTGAKASICGYSVAGKTGTAQKPDGHGGYSTEYDASFVGFFPAGAPRVEVMVVVDSPRTSHFGGVVAAPAFEQIGSWLANYLGIPPDRPCASTG
jgi:cell division protein FtsI (penicillin-binding protein 3)